MPARGARRVVLYSPHFRSGPDRDSALYRAIPPLSHLALAGPVRDAGYDVCMLDGRWDREWRREIRDQIDQVACVGITSLTGPSVADGLEVAGYVKALRPHIPVVWGGWHATFAARQAVADPRVDVVVRGMGESTFVEVLAAYRGTLPLEKIPGITYRQGAEVIETPERPLEDLNASPAPAYEFIDASRYICSMPSGARQAGAIYSRGCPFSCEFCLDSRNKWIGLSIERMIADIEFWIARGANWMCFYDGNFFLGRKRLVEFCNAILSRRLEEKFCWTATAVGNRIVQMDDQLLGLLARAGLRQVALGAESGSPELLGRITNKTTVENTLESIRRLTRHGINQYLFFIVGYADEPEDALDRTLSLVLQAKRTNPDAEVQINFVTPLPGSDVYRYAVEKGLMQEPRSFADWARFEYVHPNLMQTGPAYARQVHRFTRYLTLAYPGHGRVRRGPAEWAKKPFRELARWRLNRKYFDWPVELAIAESRKRVVHAIRPSP